MIGSLSIGLEDKCIGTSIARPTDINIVSEADFKREASKPENSIEFCPDIDEKMFCIYLSVGKTRSTTTTTTRIPTQPSMQVSSLPPPLPSSIPKATKAPKIESSTRVVPITTPLPVTPKLTFDDQNPAESTAAQDKPQGGILKTIMNYMILFMVTVTALTFGYKWWQNQLGGRQNPQFVTDTSFFRQTPSHHNSSTVRFSPSPSTSRGPSSSTPKTKLFTERFSTTLFSD